MLKTYWNSLCKNSGVFVFQIAMNNQVTVLPNKAKHLLGMCLAALCHTKMLLEMLSLGYQGSSAESHFLFIQFPTESEPQFMCDSIPSAFLLITASFWGQPDSQMSSHKTSSYLLQPARGDWKLWSWEQQDLLVWTAEQLWLGRWVLIWEGKKPSSFSATNKGQRARQSNTNPT